MASLVITSFYAHDDSDHADKKPQSRGYGARRSAGRHGMKIEPATKSQKIVFGLLFFPLGIYWLARQAAPRWASVTISVVGSLVLIAILGAALGGGDNSKSPGPIAIPATTEQQTTEQQTTEQAPDEANIVVVKSKSFCTVTGIYDVYTGNGRVEFWLTLKNKGGKDGSIDITPVRHYDDGSTNQSAMDQVSVDVAAHQVWKGHTEAFEYKAHEHEVDSCALLAGDKEIAIKRIHL